MCSCMFSMFFSMISHDFPIIFVNVPMYSHVFSQIFICQSIHPRHRELQGHQRGCHLLSLCPQGQLLASASKDALLVSLGPTMDAMDLETGDLLGMTDSLPNWNMAQSK